MTGSNSWFVIINPTSGNFSSKRKWPRIKELLKAYEFEFIHCFTKHPGHAVKITQDAIIQGFRKFICVGGDGTIHHIINGIMSQTDIPSSQIHLGVIPVGTGNDWIKSHGISKKLEHAVKHIKNNKIKSQDIGKIEFQNQDLKTVYFNNLTGIGFDAYVVSKVGRYKHFGALAYLVGALMSLFNFKNFPAEVSFNSKTITSNALMILIGLCRYSGGGMQLTKAADPQDGLFDLSITDNFSKFNLIRSMFRLFNGSITNSEKIITAKTDEVQIRLLSDRVQLVQADGELVGSGNFRVSIIPKALSFYG